MFRMRVSALASMGVLQMIKCVSKGVVLLYVDATWADG